ncbi:MAG: hypothetical protein JOZ87_01505 [Chloroflexi bacterium]|nr:hypothetical protein [Chloroflexota bacterium]
MRTLVGTVGQSVLGSDDGERWERSGPAAGFHSDAIVRTLVNRPEAPHVVWAGTDQGVLRSEDGGRHWRRLDGALNGQQVWRIAFHPSDDKVVFVGTGTPSRATVFRSDDGGESWKALPVEIATECAAVGVPRVTDIAIDPTEPRKLWASIEVDGMRRSTDGGESWQRIDGGITNPDGHAAAVTAGPPRSVFLTVNNEIFISRDDGQSFQPVGVKQHFPHTHIRDVVFDAVDPCTAWAAIGDSTPGTTGALMRTSDAGQTWQAAQLDQPPNSAMWVVRTQPDQPKRVLAASRYGYLYESQDGGVTFKKSRREFSEVSSIVWVPD